MSEYALKQHQVEALRKIGDELEMIRVILFCQFEATSGKVMCDDGTVVSQLQWALKKRGFDLDEMT